MFLPLARCYERLAIPGLSRRARVCAQLQKLKVDTEAAMLELDQIMRQNELTIAVVAALPALAIAGFALTALRAWLTPSPPDPRWEALPARCGACYPSQVFSACFPARAPSHIKIEVIWQQPCTSLGPLHALLTKEGRGTVLNSLHGCAQDGDGGGGARGGGAGGGARCGV